MRHLALPLGMVASLTLVGSAQQPPRESFEVASVKPNAAADAPEAVQLLPGGGLRMAGFRLLTLLRVAYASTTIRNESITGRERLRNESDTANTSR